MSVAELTVEDAIFNIFDFPTSNINLYFNTLQADQVKKAFRKKVKLYHPDRAAVLGKDQEGLEFKFKLLHESYNLLLSLIKKREVRQQFHRASGNTAKGTRVQPDTTGRQEKKKNHSYTKKEQPPREEQGKGEKSKTFFYSGAIPERPLRFAEYLFYTGQIDWMTLIDSLVWQYKARPRIGDVARNLGIMNTDTVRYILKNCKLNERFGDTATRYGVLTPYQLEMILVEQKKYNLPIGTYFVKHKIVDNMALFKKIAENRIHNRKYKERRL